jgi:hypothetical protein
MTSLETQIIFSPTLANAIIHFFRYHPASRVNKKLRNMLVEYLQCTETKEVQEIQSLLFDLEGVFNFLDVVEAEWKDMIE